MLVAQIILLGSLYGILLNLKWERDAYYTSPFMCLLFDLLYILNVYKIIYRIHIVSESFLNEVWQCIIIKISFIF